MRKILLIAVLLTATFLSSYAGGLLTNANQSAAYIRMPARDASIGIDALYYNPAGLTQLENGFHVSFSNQTVFQKKKITNSYALLNSNVNPVGEYIGDVTVPFFPSIYAVYKKDKLALGLGFHINAGGGSAEFANGLPSFESQIAVLPAALTAAGIPTSNYGCDIYFNGKSIFWGVQLNGAYQINDMISVSAGARLILARNSYEGHISNISINPATAGGNMVLANTFFSGMAAQATTAANNLGAIITGGGGDYTLAQLVGAGFITQDQADQLSGGLGSNYNEAMTASMLQGAYNGIATTMNNYATATADKQVDVAQKGIGITPIIGIDIKPNEKWNIGIKYEFRTKLILTNETTTDNTGMFPDKLDLRSDIPAILSVGASYQATEKLNLNAGMHYYFDTDARFDYLAGDGSVQQKYIDGNMWEVALGAEYNVTDKLLLSLGGFYTQKGVDDSYQSDMTHSLTSYSVGLGGSYKLTEKLMLTLGAFNTFYIPDEKEISYGAITATEKYDRTNTVFAIGVDYKF